LAGGAVMQALRASQDSKAKLCIIRGSQPKFGRQIGDGNERLWTLLGRLPRNWDSLQRDWHPTRGSRMGLRGYQDSRP